MSAEILINAGPREVRGALLEQGLLQEIFVERTSRRGLVGNIYKGRVSRVLPGMQAAFIEIGLERTAFLHAADIGVAADEQSCDPGAVEPDIRRLVKEGDEVVVQVVKDPIGGKGARLSTAISLPSLYVVFMPFGDGIGVSTRIAGETERQRLRAVLTEALVGGQAGGYIVRTAAANAPAEAIAADLAYLERLWMHVRERSLRAAAGDLLHEDLPLPLRLLRDELSRGVERVLVDTRLEYDRMRAFAQEFLPAAVDTIELHQGSRPIFELHATEEEIARALDRKVTLKSGGYLVIDQTESMTTIDVNTGGFVGYRNLEDTIFRTNLEAAVAIARQLRLRNLGGIIIIDFIDMEDQSHQRQVIEALERSLAGDRAQNQIAALSTLGLIEMTRKRTRESLEQLLCAPCPTCDGRGFVRSVETVCHEVFREVLRQARQFPSRELLILAHHDVVDRLLGEDSAVVAELEAAAGRPIRLQAEALYDVDQYDVVVK